MSGRDALAIMPTGAGKSVCYQVPALMLPGNRVSAKLYFAIFRRRDGRSLRKLRELSPGIQALEWYNVVDAILLKMLYNVIK